jgi:hypothetical protein
LGEQGEGEQIADGDDDAWSWSCEAVAELERRGGDDLRSDRAVSNIQAKRRLLKLVLVRPYRLTMRFSGMT